MFTKNIKDQFSADLLNTVKDVLDEAKKCKDCGCKKCECEDDEDEKEEMKEASTAEKNKQYIEVTHLLGHKKRVPVHPLNAYKALNRYRNDPSTKSARIVSESEEVEEGFVSAAQRKAVWATRADGGKGHPDNKKKKMKEEVEDLDEDSRTPQEKVDHAIRDHNYDMMRTTNHADRAEKKEDHKAFLAAMKKKHPEVRISEEVDQIDELSKKTLGAYGSKSIRAGLNASSTGDEKTADKRFAGVNRASAKMYPNQYKNSPLKAKVNATEEIDPDLEKDLKATRQTKKSVGGKWKTVSYKTSDGKWASKDVKEDVEQIDEIGNTPAGKRALGRYIKDRRGTILGSGMEMQRQNQDRSTTDKQRDKTGRRASNAFIGVSRAVDRLTKEEVDQIDELSKDTMGRYINKAKQHIDTTAWRQGYREGERNNPSGKFEKRLTKRHKGIETAVKKLTKEEQDFLEYLNSTDIENIEEGRGRPPKEGSPAWHARQKQADDDMVALGLQLRKAKSMNKKVRFMDGKEHEVSINHADRFEDHMAARKTSQEKAAFQKQAHKSHADFVKAVSAPVPKAAKDTGEIVKYRH